MGNEKITLPDMGEGVDSATVVSILVSEGDEIEKDQALMELETEKAVSEVPSPQAGTVAEIHVENNQKVTQGDLLLTLETGGAEQQETEAKEEAKKTQADQEEGTSESEGEEKDETEAAGQKLKEPKNESRDRKKDKKPSAEAEAGGEDEDDPDRHETGESEPAAKLEEEQQKEEQRPQGEKTESAATTYAPGSEIPATPTTRRLARELGVDLHRVEPSGKTGLIEEVDVMAAARDASRAQAEQAENRDEWGPIHREKLSSIRKSIARKMHESRQNAAQATNTDDADITELTGFYEQSRDETDRDLSLLAFVFRAVIDGLKKNPVLNASLDLESGEIVHKDYISIGMAVDTERGLVVPVIRNADRKTVSELTESMKSIGNRARSGELEMEDMRGGTFTVSNMGTIGGRYAIPVINYPESAILLVGKARREPRVVDDDIEIRTVMPLSLSYDHRLIDGAVAARFLNDLIASLESPVRLLT